MHDPSGVVVHAVTLPHDVGGWNTRAVPRTRALPRNSRASERFFSFPPGFVRHRPGGEHLVSRNLTPFKRGFDFSRERNGVVSANVDRLTEYARRNDPRNPRLGRNAVRSGNQIEASSRWKTKPRSHAYEIRSNRDPSVAALLYFLRSDIFTRRRGVYRRGTERWWLIFPVNYRDK